MDFDSLIGLEVCKAQSILQLQGITNFEIVYYVDRKQTKFDKELITAVRRKGDFLQLVVCCYQLAVD